MIPTIRELNSVNPDNDEELHRMIQQEREHHGPNGTFGTSNPIPMARTSELLRLHTSVVKSMWASDGTMSTNGPKMPTWGRGTKGLHG